MAFLRRQRAATRTQVLLLILFLCLAVGYWRWRDSYGVIGTVHPIDFSTADHVAFLRQDADGRTDLYVVKLDGSGEQRLTNEPTMKKGIGWSPDGKQICYTAEVTDGAVRAFQIFLFGSGSPKQLTHGSGSKDAPSYRPDGRQIAFMVGGTIKVVDPNGEHMEQVYPHFHKESEEEKRSRRRRSSPRCGCRSPSSSGRRTAAPLRRYR
jgi:Tol biopolymer transport system component